MKTGFYDRRKKLERIVRSRRRFPRFYRKLDLAYTSDRTMFFTKIENLSLRGVLVTTTTPDPIGTTCNMRFFIKDQGAMIKIRGQVTRIVRDEKTGLPIGMAIKFIEMPESNLKRIAAFLLKEGGMMSFPQLALKNAFWF